MTKLVPQLANQVSQLTKVEPLLAKVKAEPKLAKVKELCGWAAKPKLAWT